MKALPKKLLIIAIVMILAIAFIGCKRGTSGSTTAERVKLVEVDLSTLPLTINPDEFEKNYDDLLILFPPWPDNIDWSYLNRVRININCYWDDMDEITPGDTNAMVSLIYDINGDIRGPADGPGPNTPLKHFNVGGPSGTIHTEGGARLFLDRAPQAILFQNSHEKVSFIEVTEITFFRAE